MISLSAIVCRFSGVISFGEVVGDFVVLRCAVLCCAALRCVVFRCFVSCCGVACCVNMDVLVCFVVFWLCFAAFWMCLVVSCCVSGLRSGSI